MGTLEMSLPAWLFYVQDLGMLMQTRQGQGLLNAYKLVAFVTRGSNRGSNSKCHFDFGNVKALLKLNVENESMKRDRGQWAGL